MAGGGNVKPDMDSDPIIDAGIPDEDAVTPEPNDISDVDDDAGEDDDMEDFPE